MIHLMDLMKKKCNLMENLIKSITIIQDIIYAFPLKKKWQNYNTQYSRVVPHHSTD
jgi:hypothetical protein